MNKPKKNGPWKNKSGVFKYLIDAGYEVKRQAFYNHANPKHPTFKLPKKKRGYSKKDVDKYAESCLKKKKVNKPKTGDTKLEDETVGPWTTKADVFKYLIDAGYEVKRQAFYNHAKPGHPTFKLIKTRGVYSKVAVDEYAESCLRKKSTNMTTEDNNRKSLFEIKTKEEIKQLKFKNAKAELLLNVELGKYFLKTDFALEVSARAAVLDSGFNYMINANILKLIDLAGGDPKTAPMVVAELRKEWNNLLTEYARLSSINVIFKNK